LNKEAEKQTECNSPPQKEEVHQIVNCCVVSFLSMQIDTCVSWKTSPGTITPIPVIKTGSTKETPVDAKQKPAQTQFASNQMHQFKKTCLNLPFPQPPEALISSSSAKSPSSRCSARLNLAPDQTQSAQNKLLTTFYVGPFPPAASKSIRRLHSINMAYRCGVSSLLLAERRLELRRNANFQEIESKKSRQHSMCACDTKLGTRESVFGSVHKASQRHEEQ